jgi:hypothetical protein
LHKPLGKRTEIIIIMNASFSAEIANAKAVRKNAYITKTRLFTSQNAIACFVTPYYVRACGPFISP